MDPVTVKIGADDISYRKVMEGALAKARKISSDMAKAARESFQAQTAAAKQHEQQVNALYDRMAAHVKRYQAAARGGSTGTGGGAAGKMPFSPPDSNMEDAGGGSKTLAYLGRAYFLIRAIRAAMDGVVIAATIWQARQAEINGKIEKAYRGYQKALEEASHIPLLGDLVIQPANALTGFFGGPGTAMEAMERASKTQEEEQKQGLNNAKRILDAEKRLREARGDTSKVKADNELNPEKQKLALLNVEFNKTLDLIEEKKKGETNLAVLEQLDQQKRLAYIHHYQEASSVIELKARKERYDAEQIMLEIQEKQLRIKEQGYDADAIAIRRKAAADIYGVSSAAGGAAKMTAEDIAQIARIKERANAEEEELAKKHGDKMNDLEMETRRMQLVNEDENDAAEILAQTQHYDEMNRAAESFEQKEQVRLQGRLALTKLLQDQMLRLSSIQSGAYQAALQTKAAMGVPGAETAAQVEALRSKLAQDLSGAHSQVEKSAIVARTREELAQIALHATAGAVTYSGLADAHKNIQAAALTDTGGTNRVVDALKTISSLNSDTKENVKKILDAFLEALKNPRPGLAG